jgi:hypothetical protein
MTDDELYDFTIAVDYDGYFRILEAPRGFADWLNREGQLSPDFDGVPDARGNVYRVIARFSSRNKKIEHAAFAGGVLYVPGFSVVQYKLMHLRPSGAFVGVPTETDR